MYLQENVCTMQLKLHENEIENKNLIEFEKKRKNRPGPCAGPLHL